MFTPASERSICFFFLFFIFFFFFYFLFASILHFFPRHVYIFHCGEHSYERSRASGEREGERKKKSCCWLWHWKEGSMSARRISRYFSTWNRRCTVEIRDDGYDLSSIRIIHLWSIDVNHSRTYFSSVIRKITKFYLLIYAFTWKEKYLFARVLFFFFFN